ncbi:MAG: glycosyltransferase family 4 protein [Gemmatimonadota bacterium]|nr:glycosyltransferase family 4 protein [Gemmatimonadota bacterium]
MYDHIADQRPEWDIRLYGESEGDYAMARSNLSSHVLNIPGFRFNLWENVGLPLVAKFGGSDLLHGASSSTPRFPLVPTVMTVHDVIPLVFDDGQDQTAIDRFRTQLEFGLRRARAVIAVSQNTKADLVSLFGLDPAKITVVHWGADSPLPKDSVGSRDAALTQVGIVGPYLLAFAGEARRKNTEMIIRAFALVNPDGPKLVLVGVNNAAGRKRFGELAHQLHCGERVVIFDYVTDESLEIVLQESVALLYVSLYEGFGLPLLEAMVRGIPIIASDVSSIPEIVGDAALLVSPSNPVEIAEAIEEIVSTPAHRRELIERGVKRAGTFRWEATAAQTIAIFESVSGS